MALKRAFLVLPHLKLWSELIPEKQPYFDRAEDEWYFFIHGHFHLEACSGEGKYWVGVKDGIAATHGAVATHIAKAHKVITTARGAWKYWAQNYYFPWVA